MAFSNLDLPKTLFKIYFPHCFNIVDVPKEGLTLVDLTISQLADYTEIPIHLKEFFESLCSTSYSFIESHRGNLINYLSLITGQSEEEINSFLASSPLGFDLQERRNPESSYSSDDSKYWGVMLINGKRSPHIF